MNRTKHSVGVQGLGFSGLESEVQGWEPGAGVLWVFPKAPCSYTVFTWALKVVLWEPLWALSIYYIPTWSLWVWALGLRFGVDRRT